jgi:phospholipid/cholesterol/gamma-HCH transport system substrate-binding protein
VGKVSSISLDHHNPQRVNLLFAIEAGTPIKVDTIAILKTQGLTGITYVELSGGTANSPPLLAAPGQKHPVIRTQASLSARLENILTSVLEKLDSTSDNVNAVLSAENQAAFKSALADIAVITRTLAARKDTIDGGISNAGRTLQNTAQASERLDDVLNRVGGGADSLGKTGDTLAELERLLGELNTLSVSVRRLVEQTERDPRGLIFGHKPVPPGPGESATAP